MAFLGVGFFPPSAQTYYASACASMPDIGWAWWAGVSLGRGAGQTGQASQTFFLDNSETLIVVDNRVGG